MSQEFSGEIDKDAVIAQLQHENEEYRVRLTQAMKSTPISEAVDSMIVLVQKTDPMKAYLWVMCACAVLLVLARFIEVIFIRP
jgi:hypothetical protein